MAITNTDILVQSFFSIYDSKGVLQTTGGGGVSEVLNNRVYLTVVNKGGETFLKFAIQYKNSILQKPYGENYSQYNYSFESIDLNSNSGKLFLEIYDPNDPDFNPVFIPIASKENVLENGINQYNAYFKLDSVYVGKMMKFTGEPRYSGGREFGITPTVKFVYDDYVNSFSGQYVTKYTILADYETYSKNYRIGTIEDSWFNKTPILSLNTINNRTIYENDTLQIAGTTNDPDANQSVTVYYQINSETRKVLATDVSQKTIALNKTLTFKSGKLFDGSTAITGALTEGVAHKLKVWAVDDQGGTSPIVERTFYVVPNRAPVLTVNTPTITGNIDTDKITLSGSFSDPDGNTCTVSYKINGSNSIQIASGINGNWNFEILFGDLKEGENSIVIENTDSYGAKTSKTVKLNKKEIKTPLLKSTARYKLEPPTGSAKGVLLYIQRDQNLAIDVKISMTLNDEPESFIPMTLENTAPLPNDSAILEDEFYYETTDAKENIILQIDMTRNSIDVSDQITLIQGAFD